MIKPPTANVSATMNETEIKAQSLVLTEWVKELESKIARVKELTAEVEALTARLNEKESNGQAPE